MNQCDETCVLKKKRFFHRLTSHTVGLDLRWMSSMRRVLVFDMNVDSFKDAFR